MKKATMFTVYLALWIIALFSISMGMTFVADWVQLSGFFGDVRFVAHPGSYGGMVTYDGLLDDQWIWGARHYWYFWMCVLLFILSAVRIIIWVSYYWELDEPSK